MHGRPRRSSTGLVGMALPVLLVVGMGACGGEDDAAGSTLPGEASEGRQLALRSGCAACHGSAGQGGTGPPWAGLLGADVELEDGTTVVADEAYLARSITDPGAQVHDGYSVQMPQNQLPDDEVAEIVAYIVALGPVSTGTGG